MKNSRNDDRHRFDPGQFMLENFLPYRLSLLTNTISQGIAESYRKTHDISITEWRILAVLGGFPGLSASEVVERTAMDKVAISRAVKCLEDKGLLERRTHPSDRRRQSLFITANAGQAVLNEVVPLAQRFEAELLSTLDGNEIEDLHRIVSKLQSEATERSGGNRAGLKATKNKKSRE